GRRRRARWDSSVCQIAQELLCASEGLAVSFQDVAYDAQDSIDVRFDVGAIRFDERAPDGPLAARQPQKRLETAAGKIEEPPPAAGGSPLADVRGQRRRQNLGQMACDGDGGVVLAGGDTRELRVAVADYA